MSIMLGYREGRKIANFLLIRYEPVEMLAQLVTTADSSAVHEVLRGRLDRVFLPGCSLQALGCNRCQVILEFTAQARKLHTNQYLRWN